MSRAKEILPGKSRENCNIADQEGSIKMDDREINSEDGKVMEVVQDSVQWRVLVLSIVFKILLPDNLYVVEIALLTALINNRIYRVLLCGMVMLRDSV
jgi:hypothetical protein